MDSILFKRSYADLGVFDIDPAAVDLMDKVRRDIIDGLELELEKRITALIRRRLGVATIELTALRGRLERLIVPSRAYEVLMLDGRPFARVYPVNIEQGGGWFNNTLNATQCIEAIEA